MLPTPRGSSLLALLLRVPLRFDPADVRFLDLLVPVAGALALLLVAGDVSVLHTVLLCMCVVDDDLFSLLRSPLRGHRPVGLSYQRCLDRFLLPSASGMLYINNTPMHSKFQYAVALLVAHMYYLM